MKHPCTAAVPATEAQEVRPDLVADGTYITLRALMLQSYGMISHS